MKFELTATITHKSFGQPLIKRFVYEGDSLASVIDTLETLPFHKQRLKFLRRTSFKDVHGVKHAWVIKRIDPSKVD